MRRLLVFAVLLLAATCASAQVKLVAYTDPGGVWALQVPETWKTDRNQMGEMGWSTTLGEDGAKTNIEIITVASQQDLQPGQLQELAGKFFELVLQSFQEQGQVTGTTPVADRLAGRAALKRLLVVKKADGGEEAAVLLVTLGKRNLVAASVSGPKADADALQKCVDMLKTMTIDGTGAAVGGADSIFTPGTLAAAASDMKGNFAARDAAAVLAEGTPPLTEGAVRNFCDLVAVLYNLQLGEAEVEGIRQQFIVSYAKQDTEGRKVLVTSAGDLLRQCKTGTAEEQTASRANVKQVFDGYLERGAQAGMPWALALYQAVQRRSQGLATATAAAPAAATATMGEGKVDKEFSQADLDAALEMLYFMWVASGRDPNLVTPQSAATVRAALVQNFANFAPDFQYLLCNAESVYAHIRDAWAKATPQERAVYAQQFGQSLDDLGLTVPRPRTGGGGGGSAWDDVSGMSHSDLLAARVQGTAWNLAQKSSGGW